MTTKIKTIVTLAAVAGIGLLAAKNWGTLKSIGYNVSSSVSSALKTIDNKTVKAAGKE